jgi:hypothetical protein
MNAFDGPVNAVYLVPLKESTRLCHHVVSLQRTKCVERYHSVLNRLLRLESIGVGSLSRTATVISRMWTTSNAPTNSAGGSSKIFHVDSSTLSGSQASGGHWSSEMSTPCSREEGGRLLATSRSQMLYSRVRSYLLVPNVMENVVGTYPFPVATSATLMLGLIAISGCKLNPNVSFQR